MFLKKLSWFVPKTSILPAEKVYILYYLYKKAFLQIESPTKGHHKTNSYDRLATEPVPINEPEQMSSSNIITTEMVEDERQFSMFSRKKAYAKSHIHLPQNKNSNKVSFDPQTLNQNGNDCGSPSLSSSPGTQKNNFSWFNESVKTKTNSSSVNSLQEIKKNGDSKNIENSKEKEKKEHPKKSPNNENHDDNNKNGHNYTNIISNNNNNEEKKSCFMGLYRFKSAMASKNPFFLSGMGFSALSTRDSSSIFQSARSLQNSIKMSKSLKESSPSQTLFHLPIEKPLLSKEDLSFIEKMMTQHSEENIKILNSKNEKETLKRKAMDVNLEGQEWEISEYTSKDFNLDNVYKNFLIEQKPRILLPLKSSSDSEKTNNLPPVIEKENDDTATLRRKTNHLKVPMTSKGSDRKHSNFSTLSNEDIVEFLSNSFYEKGSDTITENEHEDEMLRLNEIVKNCRKFDEIQAHNMGVLSQEENMISMINNTTKISQIVENVKLNVCIKFTDDPEKEIFSIGKLSFNLSQSGLFLLANQHLVLDFSGKRLVQMIMNHQANKTGFQVIWQDNKLLIPNESLILGENTLTFLTGTESKILKNPLLFNDFSSIMPSFKDFDKAIDVQMTWIYPKKMSFISSLSEIFEHNLDDFEIDSDLCLENFILKKIKSKNTLKNDAFMFGKLETIITNESFNFYCKSANKKNFLKKAMALLDVLRLAEAYFNNYLKSMEPLKTNLKLVFIEEQKVPLKVFRGLVLLKASYMHKEEKFPELLFILLKLLLKEIFLSNEIYLKPEYSWMFHGLSGFLIIHFLEKPISSNFEIPINEILLFMIQGKATAIEQNLLKAGAHKLNETSLDSFQIDDPLCIFKSIYFFKQLAAYIGKKAIHQVLMELDYKNFSVKLFLKSLEPFLRENELVYFKKWLGVWLCGLGLQEIEFEIYNNPQRPLFLNELLILQRPLNWVQGSHELNYHFLAFSLVNNAGVSQFTLDIVIPNTSESCIIDKIKGKYVPKALILDPDDNGYFIYKFDLKTRCFLFRNIHKISEFKMRANCYCAFYLETLIGRLNVLDFFEMALKGMGCETEFYIMKFLNKSCKLIYRTMGSEDMRIRLFGFFISLMHSKKFTKKNEFFFKNAIFYSKTMDEFELLEQTFEKMEKANGISPYFSQSVKLLWKKTLFYHITEKSIVESTDLMNQNQSFLEKMCINLESDLIKQVHLLYNQMLDYLNLGTKVVYEKLSFLLTTNSFRNNYLDFESLVLLSQILEEYAFSLNCPEQKNSKEEDPIEITQVIEYIQNNEEIEEEDLWGTLKFLISFIGRRKILEGLDEKRCLKKILGQKAEIEELLKSSMNVMRLI